MSGGAPQHGERGPKRALLRLPSRHGDFDPPVYGETKVPIAAVGVKIRRLCVESQEGATVRRRSNAESAVRREPFFR